MMERLKVYLNNQFSGYLWLTGQQAFNFQYDTDYLTHPNAMALSLALPLQPGIYLNERAKPFFSNLLPEGEIRSYISKIKKISEKNDFKLLEAIGGECAGSVTILPENQEFKQSQAYIPLSDKDLFQLIGKKDGKPLITFGDELRLSLAGAQDKIPVYQKHHKWYLTKGDAPSSHIIKPQSGYFESLIENEFFCMQLAHKIGLNVPKTDLKSISGKIFYVIERYDRSINTDGIISRIHQEDFCQVKSCMPENKYESEGGPGIKDCFDVIKKHSIQPGRDKLALLRWVFFNYLVGNADAHGKNLSFLLKEKNSVVLAPFYDLISTLAYPDLSKRLAMKIGGENRSKWIFKRHWERLGIIAEVKFSLLKKQFMEFSQQILENSKTLKNEIEDTYGENKIYEDICDVIGSTSSHIDRFL